MFYGAHLICTISPLFFFFFFNDTATTEIYTLSLHDALPISLSRQAHATVVCIWAGRALRARPIPEDRKSTRLNSSHVEISYAVFCLKKKKKKKSNRRHTHTPKYSKIYPPTDGPVGASAHTRS